MFSGPSLFFLQLFLILRIHVAAQHIFIFFWYFSNSSAFGDYPYVMVLLIIIPVKTRPWSCVLRNWFRLSQKMYILIWHSNLPYFKISSVDNKCKCKILSSSKKTNSRLMGIFSGNQWHIYDGIYCVNYIKFFPTTNVSTWRYWNGVCFVGRERQSHYEVLTVVEKKKGLTYLCCYLPSEDRCHGFSSFLSWKFAQAGDDIDLTFLILIFFFKRLYILWIKKNCEIEFFVKIELQKYNLCLEL